jgi:hypothetical protein
MTTRLTFRFTGAGEDFGPRADGLVTGHTVESPYNKLTLADAMSIVRWQDRPDIAGSYNDIICIDGILSCVPPEHASGGINPGSPDWAPEQWLFDLLPDEQVRNPNYFTRNVSFMGSRAWFDANGWPPAMIDNFVTVLIEEEERIKDRVVLTQHEDFQNNRSDAGNIAHRLIQKRYVERKEAAMWQLRVKAITPYWATVPAGTYTRPAPVSTGEYYKLPTERRLLVVGTVDGAEANGSTKWLVYGSANGGFWVTHSSNETKAEPLATRIEVPTGITQAQVDAAVAAAVSALKQKVAEAIG